MRFRLDAPLFLVVAFLALTNCLEFHAGHAAEHQTALWRRLRPNRLMEGSKMQMAIGAHDQHLMNITTTLHDMKTEYIGNIGVGTNSEGGALFDARVVFDTGSTNLWVASTLCHLSPCDTERAQSFYDPERSLTQEDFPGEDGDIDIMFGTGELKGPIHVDTYRVGPMVVKRQPFAMIREMNGDVFSSFPFEGILGLGFKSMSFGGIEPFFERVIKQKLLTNNEFAFYFNVDSNQPSALLWGGIDPDLFHGPIRMFPVVQHHYWALELLDVRLGKHSVSDMGSMDGPIKRLIVDSGTTYFTVPQSIYEQLVSHVPEADCDKVSEYPPLTYVLKGVDGETYELVVSQETYMIGGNGGSCRPAFMPLDVNQEYGPAMILGEVFMRHFFTVFSRGDGVNDNARVGFAPAKMGAIPKVKPSAKPSFVQIEESGNRKRVSIPKLPTLPSSRKLVDDFSNVAAEDARVANTSPVGESVDGHSEPRMPTLPSSGQLVNDFRSDAAETSRFGNLPAGVTIDGKGKIVRRHK